MKDPEGVGLLGEVWVCWGRCEVRGCHPDVEQQAPVDSQQRTTTLTYSNLLLPLVQHCSHSRGTATPMFMHTAHVCPHTAQVPSNAV